MRFLHTSDWHVGRTFHGADLLAEQEAVLGHLADLVAGEAIDAVLVAGDIYDRAVPSAEAVRVATAALARIRAAGAQLVVTPGNHDSAPRLGAFAEFAAAGGLHLRTTVGGLAEPVLFDDEHGPVAVYGIPYLEPEPRGTRWACRTRAATPACSPRRCAGSARTSKPGRAPGRSCWRTRSSPAASRRDSERTIAVGGVEQVPGSVFDGVDYVALGHLHGPQTLAEHLRYSGSPLAYSFSEARQRKSVWLVDLDTAGLAEVRRARAAGARGRWPRSRGELEDLLADPGTTNSWSTSCRSRSPTGCGRWTRCGGCASGSRTRCTWSGSPKAGTSAPRCGTPTPCAAGTDIEIARSFLDDCRGAPPTESEEQLLFKAPGSGRTGRR